MNDVDAIKSRLNIVEVVSEKVRLKKAGVNYFGLCPFHNEKSPSFSVNENLQMFKCFGCGESGDVISFIQKTENIDFLDALRELADKVGYKLPERKFNRKDDNYHESIEKLLRVNLFVSRHYQKKLNTGENAGKDYAFNKRGLNDELINEFGIGYTGEYKDELMSLLLKKGLSKKELIDYGLVAEKEGSISDKFRNRLMFSIFDERGRIVGFSGRFIGKENQNFKPPKYLNSPETDVFKKSRVLFGLYQAKEAIKKLNFVIVSEGQMNIISSHKVGVKNIVASLGTSFTDEHLRILLKYTDNIYLAFDKDQAGKNALKRTLELIYRQTNKEKRIAVKVIGWDKVYGKDPDELISQGKELWINAVNNALEPTEYMYNEFIKNNTEEQVITKSIRFRDFVTDINSNLSDRDEWIRLEKVLADKLNINMTMTEITERVENWRSSKRNISKTLDKDEQLISKSKKFTLNEYACFIGLLLQHWDEENVKKLFIDKNFIDTRNYLIEQYRNLFDLLCSNVEDDLGSIEEYIKIYLDESQYSIYSKILYIPIDLDDNIPVEKHILRLIPKIQNKYKHYLMEKGKHNPEDSKLKEEIRRLTNIKI
jgi:DNA primase